MGRRKKKKLRHKKVIKGEPLEDKVGSYFGVCMFRPHIGIVRYNQYRICEFRECGYYVRYRPENE